MRVIAVVAVVILATATGIRLAQITSAGQVVGWLTFVLL